MKFDKTISISDQEIIQEIQNTYSVYKRKNLIMKILPDDYYTNTLDLYFIMSLMDSLLSKASKELVGSGFESEAKEIRQKIQNLHDKISESGW